MKIIFSSNYPGFSFAEISQGPNKDTLQFQFVGIIFIATNYLGA